MHRLDPRLRVAAAFVLSCLIAVTQSPTRAACGLLFASLALAASRPPCAPLGRRLAAVNVFILFLWLTVPWSAPGPTVFRLGLLSISAEGLRLMTLITLKANAILLLTLACVATMPVAAFGRALGCLGVPNRFVLLLLFTYRAIFLLADEWRRLRMALKLRGFVPGPNLRTYRVFGALVGLTLLRGADRAERMHQAMRLKGFVGRFHTLAQFSAGPADALFLLAVLCFFILFLCL